MNLSEIERHARALMTAHGVGRLDFAFDGGKNRIAGCHMRHFPNQPPLPFKISLSRHYAPHLTEAQLSEVMLHEIAHALSPSDPGHGYEWKRVARRLGISGDRCMPTGVNVPKAAKGVCTNPDCQKVVVEQHRLPLRVWFHSKCGRDYPLRWFKNGKMMKISDMPARYRAEYERNFSKSRASA